MQTASFRYLVLTLVLLTGAALYTAFGEPLGMGKPRWPDADALYTVDLWSVGPQKVERVITADFVTRVYKSTSGANATLTLVTNQAPKLYAAGPEVPFLGDGYSVETASPETVPLVNDGVSAIVARRGTEQWLVMYAYGERRGLLGNGPLAWSLALSDGMLGHANDYFKLFLFTRADRLDASLGHDVAGLAHTLFPRIQAWYAV